MESEMKGPTGQAFSTLWAQLCLKCDTSHNWGGSQVLEKAHISPPRLFLRLAGSFTALINGFQPPYWHFK